LVPVAVQTIPGGQVVGSHDGPLPAQVGPHEQPPDPLSVQVSPGMHAPPQVGAVPLSQRGSQVQGFVPVAVQTIPGGQVVGSHDGPLPAHVGPHEQPPDPLSVQVSPVMQSPLHIGALPAQLAARPGPGCASDRSAEQATSKHPLRKFPIAIPPLSAVRRGRGMRSRGMRREQDASKGLVFDFGNSSNHSPRRRPWRSKAAGSEDSAAALPRRSGCRSRASGER